MVCTYCYKKLSSTMFGFQFIIFDIWYFDPSDYNNSYGCQRLNDYLTIWRLRRTTCWRLCAQGTSATHARTFRHQPHCLHQYCWKSDEIYLFASSWVLQENGTMNDYFSMNIHLHRRHGFINSTWASLDTRLLQIIWVNELKTTVCSIFIVGKITLTID